MLVVPGPITSHTSLGCNRLIQQGAKPVLCAADILEELGLGGAARPEPVTAPALDDLSAMQRSLWDALTEQRHVDMLVAAAGVDVGTVLTALTVFFATAVLYLFGGKVLEDLAFVLTVGVITGTYSTIFIAGALVVEWTDWVESRFRRPKKVVAKA